ncbi:MAG: TFIIB-type zinc ribbon-containing protein [Acidobacteriota bacterium]
MNCPVCESVKLTMSEKQGIEVDYCPQCRGVWLDRGELDKIIDRSVADTPRQNLRDEPRAYRDRPDPAPDYHDSRRGEYDSDRGGHYKKKKREGFLSDLFDFD